MDISIKRDGLTLRGTLIKPEGVDKCPAAVLFHGIMSNRANKKVSMHSIMAEKLLKRGIASVRFDFNGHGESDGEFSDMTVYGELLDAAKIMEYVTGLEWAEDIYIFGHSMGALVGGMTAGYYRERVKKLVMLAPAATLRDDALRGLCFGRVYDTYNPPEYVDMTNLEGDHYHLGQAFMRTSRTLPIYETTSMFRGKTLIFHGTKDEAVGLAGSEGYERCMRDVTLRIIEGETHGLDTINLDAVLEEAAEFFAG